MTSKKKLFEMMGKINPEFKIRLNETDFSQGRINPDTGEVIGGYEKPEPMRDYWNFEGYGEELFNAIKNGKNLTKGNIEDEKHEDVLDAITKIYNEYPDALKNDVAMRVKNEGDSTIIEYNLAIDGNALLGKTTDFTFKCINGMCERIK